MDFNNCSFTGRLTENAEMRTLPTGKTVVVFNIANNTGYGDYEKVLFITVQLWGKTGDKLCEYLVKGKAIAISGNLEVQKWTSQKDGTDHFKLVLNSSDIVLLSDGKKSAQDSANENGASNVSKFDTSIKF
jgi:single-strand DNA-binding protein